MSYINNRHINIAQYQLYKNIVNLHRIDSVVNDYYHLEVTLNDDFKTKFGCVIVSQGYKRTSSFIKYIEKLKEHIDNRNQHNINNNLIPIILLCVDNNDETIQFKILVGIRFNQQFVLLNNNLIALTPTNWNKVYTYLKIMSPICGVMNSDNIYSKQIKFKTKSIEGNSIDGIIIYGRKYITELPDNSENDKLDILIDNAVKNDSRFYADFEKIRSNRIITNRDYAQLQQIRNQYPYKREVTLQINPTLKNISDNITSDAGKLFPIIIIHDITIYSNEKLDDYFNNENIIFDKLSVSNHSEWINQQNEIRKNTKSIISLDEYINLFEN